MPISSLARGRDAFTGPRAEAGADSVLVADVPALEAAPYAAAARAAGIAPVLIAAANTPAERLARIARAGAGYTYCVARAGVTGADARGALRPSRRARRAARGRRAAAVLGFGISRPEHVRAALAAGAAGVISGSAIVDLVARGEPVRGFVESMKAATYPLRGPEPADSRATFFSGGRRSVAMRIAQIAPLAEAVPPKLYGGTERVVS